MAHAQKAKEFLSDASFAKWQDEALWFVRQKRDFATKSLKEWEALREAASKIKAHTLSHLDIYLEEFERKAIDNGFVVHWAIDANEFNKIVFDILKSHNAKLVVKSKSMLTEECGLNPYLEQNGIEVVDTDLGERIIQLRGERPSHIVLPAIHLKKEQVGETFEKKLHSQKGNYDPKYLTNVAREDLRDKFLKADAAITGVNFAVANEGSFVVCTNEGNADMGTSLAPLHIAVMGIEKIVPTLQDLSIYTRVLARSATGQAITTYTSHFKRPNKNQEVHIVIVDNGRVDLISKDKFKNSLKCIRCGACMNTCPVYRRSGGHSYSYTIPGPIGSLLGSSRDLKKHGDLAFASTLCGSCNNVCPVKIDITNQLKEYRSEYAKREFAFKKRFIYKLSAKVLQNPTLLNISVKLARFAQKYLPKAVLNNRFNVWSRGREMPTIANKSFKEIYKEMKI